MKLNGNSSDFPKQPQKKIFPENNELFNVKFKGSTFKLKINTSGQIMITQLFDKHRFQEGELIKIKSTKTGYDLFVEK